MKISYNWLKQFIKIDWDSAKTSELLTNLGLEVEGISTYESVKGSLEGIVIGKVLSCIKHPNTDKLKLTTVDIGSDTPVQIVCGATNVATGQLVPVATIGTSLYTKEGEKWTVKKGKIKGEESYGMICAEDELGLGESHDGIMVLDNTLIPGTPCKQVFEIENDEVFEIGLTPNRADAMSHFGVARDLKAGLNQKNIKLELITPSISNFNIENRSLKIDIDVKNNDLAPRYCGLTISNLIVKDSPNWLKNRLKAIGLTPKNNIIDSTNYVLHELGQPLHAFDASKISGNKIVVKTLPKGTKFTTLDNIERELHEEDLMICDDEKPMCIAGVFGGAHSGVTENTTAIFLESAYFNPVSIRKTTKRHSLNTDASFRFERGIDINNTEYCLQRAAVLIMEIAGGNISSDITDIYPKKKDDYQVFLTFDKINKLIGQEIPRDTIKSIFTSLYIKINNVTESGLGLTIPFYRVDVQREVDLIEEILRIYGYDNINFKKKLNASIAPVLKFEDHKLQDQIANLLVPQGFFEIMTNSLTTSDYIKLYKTEEKNAIKIVNPLSTDLSIMRQSLLFSGLEVVLYNHNRKKQNLKFFEFGKTYHQFTNQFTNKRIENKHLCLLLTGNRNEDSWVVPQKKSDFYLLKSIVENILLRLGITKTTPIATENAVFSEGLSLGFANSVLVSFGSVKKSILKEFSIKQEILYADFNWDEIIKLATHNSIVFKETLKYPEVKRDFALLIDNTVSYKQIYDLAFKTEKKTLKNVNLFDVYTGKNLPKGKKSYALSFTLQDENKTLTDKQIDKIMSKLQQAYKKTLGAELR